VLRVRVRVGDPDAPGLRLAVRLTLRGQVLAEGPYEEVSRDPRVIEAYMGGYHG